MYADRTADAGALLGANVDCAVVTVSCRYIWWRYTSTLNWDDRSAWCAGLFCSSLKRTRGLCGARLLPGSMAAESSAGAIAEDMSLWPSVDIFVPTYNEDLTW